jgi:hypothetical protein
MNRRYGTNVQKIVFVKKSFNKHFFHGLLNVPIAARYLLLRIVIKKHKQIVTT